MDRCEEAPPLGALVRVVHPTGGVLASDRFKVVEPPEGKDDRFVWVAYEGEPRYVGCAFTRNDRPMGFHYSSLALVRR